MKEFYRDYFDASYRPELSVCAFYIEQDNKTIYREAKKTYLPDHKNRSDVAEMTDAGTNPKYTALINTIRDMQR